MEKKDKRPESHEQGQSNYRGEIKTAAVDVDLDVEKEEKKMLFKALISIQREVEACDEQERETRVVQNILKILAQVPKIFLKGIQEEIPQNIPLVQSNSVEKALQIAVVVRHVLSHLDFWSVLSSRLVCKIWEDEATSHLLTERHGDVFKIRFGWCERKGKYLHQNKKTLQDFHETCGNESRASANARRFLCSQGKIVFKGGDLKSTLAYFFNDFGVFLRFLSLKPEPEEPQAEEFQSTLHSIVMDLTPNLDMLTLKSVWNLGRNDNLDEGNPALNPNPSQTSTVKRGEDGGGLEKLTVLKLLFFDKGTRGIVQRIHLYQLDCLHHLGRMMQNHGHGQNPGPDLRISPFNTITRKIMERAPNLQVVWDPDLIHTKQIVAAGKFQLVKHIDLKFSPRDSNLFMEFAAANPKLLSLNLVENESPNPAPNPIPNPNAAAWEMAALNSILQSSRSTLEHFDGVCHLKNLGGIQLPSFPLVTKLDLTLHFDESDSSSPHMNVNANANANMNGEILPAGFDFGHVFPNLVALQFDLLQEGKSNPFNFDANDNANANANTSSSLEHLEFAVKTNFNPLWMENISSLYPNLKSLHIKISDKFALFPLVCKSTWSCLTQLTNLHLTVEIDHQRHLNKQQENGGKETEEKEEKTPIDEMDSIFTGFSPELCRKLKQEDLALPIQMMKMDDDAASFDNLRESPSIFDMKKLTELEISCVEIHPEELWSRVTEIHAFERIKQRQNVKIQVTQSKNTRGVAAKSL